MTRSTKKSQRKTSRKGKGRRSRSLRSNKRLYRSAAAIGQLRKGRRVQLAPNHDSRQKVGIITEVLDNGTIMVQVDTHGAAVIALPGDYILLPENKL